MSSGHISGQPSDPRSSRNVYRARKKRGRRYTYVVVGGGALLAALVAIGLWQVISAPRILAITPAAGEHTSARNLTVHVRVKGLSDLKNMVVLFDEDDVTSRVKIDGDEVTLRRTGVADGTHSVGLEASTSNLYRGSVSRHWQFVVDTMAPKLRVKTPRKGAMFTSSTVTFTGAAEPGAEVFDSSGSSDAPVVTGQDGTFSLPLSLPDGKLTVRIAARDKAGNTTVVERRVVVDTTAPEVAVGRLRTVKERAPTATITVGDRTGNPSVRVLLDGTLVYLRLFSGTLALSLNELSEGTHTLAVRASDDAGHSTATSQTFLVDSTEELGHATLTTGATGQDVTDLQKSLKQNGAYSGLPSGVYDAATARAVRSFQRRLGLEQDGMASPFIILGLHERILVDQSKLRLYLIVDGTTKLTYPVATGQPAYPTPNGTFRVVVKSKDPTWIPPDSPWAKGLEPVPAGPGNPLGTRWIGTSAEGVGIHGTPQDWSIGSYASHGCIRMHIPDVEVLFEYVEVGMPVIIRW